MGVLRGLSATKGTMLRVFVIMVAVAALLVVAPASAHGLLVAKPKCKTLHCRLMSQRANLKHAKYLCHYGRHATKQWGCTAVRWLAKEKHETETALRPVPTDIGAWKCIHSYEGAWNANTGNGFYGGLQMDMGFMKTYGLKYLQLWGTADRWPSWIQIRVARIARDSGRGYYPWPNTARVCGLI